MTTVAEIAAQFAELDDAGDPRGYSALLRELLVTLKQDCITAGAQCDVDWGYDDDPAGETWRVLAGAIDDMHTILANLEATRGLVPVQR